MQAMALTQRLDGRFMVPDAAVDGAMPMAEVANGELLDDLLPGPCCGSQTLEERGRYEVCDVCYWADEGQEDADADEIRRPQSSPEPHPGPVQLPSIWCR